MSLKEFKIGLVEMYQGEVIGEVLVYRMLEHFNSSEQLYKLGTILQLETETKARLRPAIMQLGLDLIELDDSRDKGNEFFRTFEGMNWQAAMSHLATVAKPFVQRYRQIAQLAPAEYKQLANSMVVHEQSIVDAAELEAVGDGDHSMDNIVKQLVFPLPKIL